MYEYLDRPLGALAARDRLLLWAMRRWVASASGGRCPCGVIGPALAAQGLSHLLPDLNMAMMALNADGQGRLRFAPPCFGRVADDEARLLALFAAEDVALARRLAAQLVRPEAIATLATAAGLIAAELAATPLTWNVSDAEER